VGRLLTWLGGALGLAALWRFLRREQEAARRAPGPAPAADAVPDPAAELRAKLEEARDTADDRDDFDAAEGQPLDQVGRTQPELEAEPAPEPEPEPEPEVEQEHEPAQEPEPPRSLDERRRAIHEKAQQALGDMQQPGRDE
jgi:outer membrane biosynthesis protein TonB